LAQNAEFIMRAGHDRNQAAGETLCKPHHASPLLDGPDTTRASNPSDIGATPRFFNG